jgi:chromosome segregation ATPase
MANDNKKFDKLVSEHDDDPTAELELLSEEAYAEIEPGRSVEAESDANTFDFEKSRPDIDDANETIANLQQDLQSRTEGIRQLQFDIEQLRSRWSGLEKEIKVREEVTQTLTADLNLAHKNQSKTEQTLKKRERELDSLRSKLAAQEQSLEESARQRERSDEEASGTKMQSLSREVAELRNELAQSQFTVTELQQYIDGRKGDWEEQEQRLGESRQRIDELAEANSKLRDGGSDFDDLNARLTSLKLERDDLLKEITQLRKDSQHSDRTEDGKKLLTRQSGMLAGKDFEIRQLRNQMARTETYADELRRQLQDQLAITDTLQSRQKHLEVSLGNANARVEDLSNAIDELRSDNTLLREKNTGLGEEFDREVRRIRFELGEAQETIADRESLNQQLTSDLIDTRETNMNLETRLGSTEEESKAIIAKLKKKLADTEVMNEELQYRLSTKENAISALLDELTKRSEAIESIGEIEEVVHELDDRMSESIDDGTSADRERITRLLVGKIDGQELRFPLFKDRLTIGRTGHNDIQLKAPFISRRHAVIVSDDNATRIIDWGSKNGVFVNANRIKEYVLRNGDIVTIGIAEFKFEERRKR